MHLPACFNYCYYAISIFVLLHSTNEPFHRISLSVNAISLWVSSDPINPSFTIYNTKTVISSGVTK